MHIPHLTKGTSCTYVHTGQEREEEGGSLGEDKRGAFPSLPTSIGQDPADVDGEVFEGEDEGGGREGGRGVLLKRKLGSS